jgi:FdhD protein
MDESAIESVQETSNTFMNDFLVRKKIHRFLDTGNVKETEDDIIQESRVAIRLDDQDFIQAVCTPFQIKEFVIGFLRTRGLIDRLEDIASVDVAGNNASVIRASRLRGSLPRLDELETTGTRNVGLERLIRNKEMTLSDFRLSSGVLLKEMEYLSRMPLYVRTGGTHCAILFSQDGHPLSSAEDIGRHNAVDKTIGGGMLNGADFAKCWLAVSGRLPADMVLKAVVVGIPLIASVSAPTSHGIDTGEHAGVTVVGFVRGGKLNCYCHPERIIH